MKEKHEFKQSKRRGRHKVEIDSIFEAIVINIKKIRNRLNLNLYEIKLNFMIVLNINILSPSNLNNII